MAIYGGNDPTNMVLKTGETIKGPGKIIGPYDTTGVIPSAANGIGIGVSVGDSTRTAAGVLQTTVGATVGVVPFKQLQPRHGIRAHLSMHRLQVWPDKLLRVANSLVFMSGKRVL